MKTFYIKTVNDRNIVVEADLYRLPSPNGTQNFVFIVGSEGEGYRVVASFPATPEILGVVEEDSLLADFYQTLGEDEEEDEDLCEDDCLECQAEELSDTDAFREAGWDLIETYHEPGETPETSDTPKIEHRSFVDLITKEKVDAYGPVVNGLFFPFADVSSAEYALPSVVENPETWSSVPLDRTEVICEEF